jgi:enterochelin esterase-like enzyme
MTTRTIRLLALLLTASFAQMTFAQMHTEAPPVVAGAKPVTLEPIKIHASSVEGNLEGNAVERDVLVFLPPSYAKERARRYPVVYALHGYSIGAEQWTHEIHAPQTIEGAFASGAGEMIVVLPDSKTRHNGSMYSGSVTTGDFENFIARDVVSYIDAHYRTIPERRSRGLAGHSMGGYGTVRIGMKRPDVFSSIYALSSCCLNEGNPRPTADGKPSAAELIKSPDDAKDNRSAQGTLARAAAWAPNPAKPPLYLDLPTTDGQVQPQVAVKWAANSPVAMLDQYVSNLKKMKAIALDIGLQDNLITSNKVLVDALTRFGVAHTFETYEGDHGNRIPQRLEEKVLPFFSKQLSFDPSRTEVTRR